jgi:hypothetical protein
VTQKTNLDQKGPKTASPRAAIAIPQLEMDKQRSERPVMVVIVVVVLFIVVLVMVVVVVW